MSYAGTYGADETCRHDTYWRSCQFCNQIGPRATEEQFVALQKRRDEEWRQQQADKEAAREAKVAEMTSRKFVDKVGDQAVAKTVIYLVQLSDFTHYDCWNYQHNSRGGHPSRKFSEAVEANNDHLAQLAALEVELNFAKHKRCPQHRLGISVTGIIKLIQEHTADGWQRTTELELEAPKPKRCSCGKQYWPVKGEKACHALVRTTN